MSLFKSLLFFRILFVVSAVFFLYFLYKEYCYELSIADDLIQQLETSRLPWSDVNVEKPPRLQKVLAERLRLNELFASKQIFCQNSRKIFDKRQTFVICPQIKNTFKSGLIITGNAFSTGELPSQLNISNWIVFLPEASRLIDSFTGDVEVNYMTELNRWKDWHTWDFEQSIKGKTFSFLQFELYSSHFRSSDQPRVIRKLLELLKSPADYLLITVVVPPDDDQTAIQLLSDWYQLFFWLFFEQHYAIVGAFPGGSCGFHAQSCRYHVTLVNYDGHSPNTAPVFGLGSPVEEKKRMISQIAYNKEDCFISKQDHFPYFCVMSLSQDSNIVMIRYGSIKLSPLPDILRNVNSLYLIQPDDISSEIIQKNVRHLQFGISIQGQAVSADHIWMLKTLNDSLLELKLDSVDLLILDTDGAEWDILPQLMDMLERKQLKVSQVAIQGRIFPEENENYRRFYWLLRNLARLGFSKAFSIVENNVYKIAYINYG